MTHPMRAGRQPAETIFVTLRKWSWEATERGERMSRKEIMEHIVEMFATYPKGMQEAIVTGVMLGKMMEAKNEQQPQENG